MIKKFVYLFITLLVLTSCNKDSKEAEEIKKVFSQANTAMIEQDGLSFYNSINEKSILMFQTLLQKAKVRDLSGKPVDKFNTFQCLVLFSADELDTISVKEFILKLKNNTLMDAEQSEVTRKAELGNIIINQDKASAKVFNIKDVYFSKEGGVWKFDVTTFEDDANELIINAIKQSEVSENEFIRSLLLQGTNLKNIRNIDYNALVNECFNK